jgi:hypothetical protein
MPEVSATNVSLDVNVEFTPKEKSRITLLANSESTTSISFEPFLLPFGVLERIFIGKRKLNEVRIQCV